MKILIMYHAGVLRNAAEIYSAVAANADVELTVIVPERLAVDKVYEPSGWLQVSQRQESDGYRMIPVPLADPQRYTQGFETDPLRMALRENQPDVIHVWDEPVSHCLYQAAWLRVMASRKSEVFFYGFQNTPYKWGALGRIAWKSTWTLVTGGTAANSEALHNLGQAGFPAKRPTQRIFWGIPTELFKPMDKFGLKCALNIECEHTIGYVGRLVPEKGLTWLLAAMRQLPPQVHCLIIGNGPMRGEIELWSDLPGLSGRVHVFDAVPATEVPKYLNCMDVLVVPSVTTPHWKEQYGRVIGEAMACGVPVVGSNSGAIPEVMGSAGLIVPESNVSELAEAVHSMIFNGQARSHMSEKGLRHARRELSVQTMAERLLRFYHRALGA